MNDKVKLDEMYWGGKVGFQALAQSIIYYNMFCYPYSGCGRFITLVPVTIITNTR